MYRRYSSIDETIYPKFLYDYCRKTKTISRRNPFAEPSNENILVYFHQLYLFIDTAVF